MMNLFENLQLMKESEENKSEKFREMALSDLNDLLKLFDKKVYRRKKEIIDDNWGEFTIYVKCDKSDKPIIDEIRHNWKSEYDTFADEHYAVDTKYGFKEAVFTQNWFERYEDDKTTLVERIKFIIEYRILSSTDNNSTSTDNSNDNNNNVE